MLHRMAGTDEGSTHLLVYVGVEIGYLVPRDIGVEIGREYGK